MHMQFIITFCFNYLIIVVYCFIDINTYVEDEPPQQDEEMEEEVVEQLIGKRFVMPCRPNQRVQIKLENRICALFPREGVPCAHIREIIQVPNLFDIWCTLPYDMMTLMCHVFDALTFIQNLRAHTQSRSYPKPDEVPNDSHHDSPLANALGKRLTSPHSASHVSPDVAPFTNPFLLLLGLPPFPSPLVLANASSIYIPPPPLSPLHVS